MIKMLNELPEWQTLHTHYQQMQSIQLRELFQQDPARFDHFSIETEDLFLDSSKNHITEETLSLLIQLADTKQLKKNIEALLKGDIVNNTENRPALHCALRNLEEPLWLNGSNFTASNLRNLDKISEFTEHVQSGQKLGFTGKPITDIINIGIGGSHLGPELALEALKPFIKTKLKFHFVSNIDAYHLANLLQNCNLETCLFIISSKSFSTPETLTNAITIREYLLKSGCTPKQLTLHFAAVTNNLEKALEFEGLLRENVFTLDQGIGGRYSLWSAAGLPIVLALGIKNFKEILQGARNIDQHFYNAPLNKNMPVLLGLISIWYCNFFQAKAQAILPYCHALEKLPVYLQQLNMESNGKRVNRQGKKLTYSTAPIIFGATGTNGQHAFHQLLHQGTHIVPVDFIVPLEHHPEDLEHHHRMLFANALSQSKTFMEGTEGNPMLSANLPPHEIIPGNRPSNTILFKKLTPRTFGALLALYEHKVFVESVIWDINPFDQWGVEHSKKLANQILTTLEKGENPNHDSSTNGLIRKFLNQNS